MSNGSQTKTAFRLPYPWLFAFILLLCAAYVVARWVGWIELVDRLSLVTAVPKGAQVVAGPNIVGVLALVMVWCVVGFGLLAISQIERDKHARAKADAEGHTVRRDFAYLQDENAALSKKLKDAEGNLKVARDAVNARTQNLLDQQAMHDKTKQQLREEVEQEWQRDKVAEIEHEHARYQGYVDRQRVAKAEYEAAKQQRTHRLEQLQELVLSVYPDFEQRTDPLNQKGPAVVSAAFAKHIAKRYPDAGILRFSADPEVLSKLGPLTDFPPAPPPINPPTLIPIPENLRQRFEGQQVQRSPVLTSH